MPDFFNNNTGTTTIDSGPNGWGEAFAALPMEAPPGDGWKRLVRKLDARSSRSGTARRERRMTWLLGAASAAVLVLAAWSPLSQWLQADEAKSQPAAVIAQAVPGMRGPAAPIRTEPDEPQPVATRIAETPGAAKATETQAATQPAHRKPTRSTRALAARKDVEPQAVPASDPPAQVEPTLTQASTTGTVATASSDIDPLQKLQAQSAQLEALVALARDDRVGNASSELLSSELDAGIAVVDAALSQADLSDTQKQELWRQRVDLLQQLAGVEATSRWLAAQGSSSSTNLVAVD